jgi:hypothetical protein
VHGEFVFKRRLAFDITATMFCPLIMFNRPLWISGSQSEFVRSATRVRCLLEKESIDVEQLARLAHWSLEPKMDILRKALEGGQTPHHRFMIEISLGHIDYIEKHILRLDEQITQQLPPF